MRPAAIRALLERPDEPLPERFPAPEAPAFRLPEPLDEDGRDAPLAAGEPALGRGSAAGAAAGRLGTGGSGSISAISGSSGGRGTGTGSASGEGFATSGAGSPPSVNPSLVMISSGTRSTLRGGGSGEGTNHPTSPKPETLSHMASVPMFKGWPRAIMRTPPMLNHTGGARNPYPAGMRIGWKCANVCRKIKVRPRRWSACNPCSSHRHRSRIRRSTSTPHPETHC